MVNNVLIRLQSFIREPIFEGTYFEVLFRVRACSHVPDCPSKPGKKPGQLAFPDQLLFALI